MIKVMFVCHGNICRSAMAKYIFRYMTNNKYIIDSAGTSNEEEGNGLYYLSKETLDKYNIPYDNHKAHRITDDEFNEYDYIIVFDSYNMDNITRRFGHNDKVRMLLPTVIDDPWYTRDFEKAYKDIYEGCMRLKEELD